MYCTEALIFKFYKTLSFVGRKYFWLGVVLLQPVSWLRTLTMLPKRNIDSAKLEQEGYDTVRLGWKTRHDKKTDISDPPTEATSSEISELGSEKCLKSDTNSAKNRTSENCKKPSIYNFLKSLIQTMTPDMWLLCLWTNLEIFTFLTLNGQFVPYLYNKLPTSDHQVAFIESFVDSYTFIAIFAMPITAPLTGIFCDFLCQFLISKYNYAKNISSLIASLIFMIFLSLLNLVAHFLLMSSQLCLDPASCGSNYQNIQNPIVILTAMTVTLGFSSLFWVVRNIYIFAAGNAVFAQKVLTVMNASQMIVPFFSSKIPIWVKNYFDGDWDGFYFYFNILILANGVIPVYLLYKTYRQAQR